MIVKITLSDNDYCNTLVGIAKVLLSAYDYEPSNIPTTESELYDFIYKIFPICYKLFQGGFYQHNDYLRKRLRVNMVNKIDETWDNYETLYIDFKNEEYKIV